MDSKLQWKTGQIKNKSAPAAWYEYCGTKLQINYLQSQDILHVLPRHYQKQSLTCNLLPIIAL